MSDYYFLLMRVAVACLINTVALAAPILLAMPFKIASTDGVQKILIITGLCLGCGMADWWILRQLRLRYTKREAKAVTTAFAVFTPVALALTMPFGLVLALLLGAYIEHPLPLFKPNTGIFEIVGTLISLVAITALLCYAVCVSVLCMTRHIQKVQQAS